MGQDEDGGGADTATLPHVDESEHLLLLLLLLACHNHPRSISHERKNRLRVENYNI